MGIMDQIGQIGAATIGTIGSAVANRKSQKRSFEYTKQLMAMQNDYNTPSAQKQRMLDAGMNPYGSAAQPVPAAGGSAPPPMPLDLSGIASLITSITGALKAPSEVDNTKADTALKQVEAAEP